MNQVFKCFITVAVVSSYILNTEAMGVCGFQRRFHDKIPKASDCNCKNETNTTSPSADVVTQTRGSSKSVSYVELMTSSSQDLMTTTADTERTMTRRKTSALAGSDTGSDATTNVASDPLTTFPNETNTTSPSADVVTQTRGSSKSVSYVELMTSSSQDLMTTTADTERTMTRRKTSALAGSDTGSDATTNVASDPLTTFPSTFETSTESLCSYMMVNEPFVNENCTQRCVCNSTHRLTCSDYSCGDNSKCGVEDDVRGCYCDDGFIKRGEDCSRPSGCHELYSAGIRENGTYTVYPPGWYNMQVYCEMGSWPPGGWTVFQRRVNGTVDFYRNWTEYRNGFGSLDHEFWLGNEALHYFTNRSDYQLRIDLSNYYGEYYYASYNLFRIGNEETGYRLGKLGNFTDGGVGYDALRDHVNVSFSTYDRDMDLTASENCGEGNHGGWWFTNCHTCYLNGVYGKSTTPGIRWYKLPGGQFNIKSTEMKIRPV